MALLREQTPIAARILALLVLIGAPRAVGAQDTWTVEDAVRVAASQPELADLLDADLASIDAATAVATLRELPRLGADVEQVLGDDAVRVTEATLGFETTFDLDNWRGDLRAASEERRLAARAGAGSVGLELATVVRRAFFAVRRAEERAGALDDWIARLEHGVADTAAREARGDVSRFELRRVERELATARAERALAEDELAEAWAELERWAPAQSRPRLVGDLMPETAQVDRQRLPELRRLEHLSAALTAEAGSWGAPWARDWTFGAGYRLVDTAASTGHGFVLSLSMPLATRNNSEAQVTNLLAERDRVARELDLRQARLVAAEAAAARRLADARAASESVGEVDFDDELIALAEAAYGAGEATLTELLDAYESQVQLALVRVELQWAARRAAIQLNHLRGIGAPG